MDRNRISAYPDVQDELRARNSVDRHGRAAAAVFANGGRSAPQSEVSRTMGLTPDDVWASMFPNRPTGTSNMRPPSMTNAEAAAAASLGPFMPQDPTRVRFNIPAPLTGPNGNAGSDAANFQQNLQLARNPRSLISARPATTEGAPRATAVTRPPASPVVQGTPQHIDPSLAAPVVNSAGITRMAPIEQKYARESLQSSHPEIFKAGTPENAAFVAYAKQHGEAAAHANIDQIIPRAVASTTPTQAPPTEGQRQRISAYLE